MSGTVPLLHLPQEVARILRCSEWWVKDQARKRRIPHSRIGGGYRFTDQHITEIITQFEVRPDAAVSAAPQPRRAASHPGGGKGDNILQLRARTPRRTRNAAPDQAAA